MGENDRGDHDGSGQGTAPDFIDSGDGSVPLVAEFLLKVESIEPSHDDRRRLGQSGKPANEF